MKRRPIDYDGLMVYSEQFGCPNEQSNWEEYIEEDNWCINDIINKSETTKYSGLIRESEIQTLKKKILEDLDNEEGVYIGHGNIDGYSINKHNIKDILDKRFGF
jgi:hypothetical protein